MIEFGNPWMLLGLLGALIPVVLHLLGRRRAQVVHFSALDFILAVHPKQARAMRLREWLLVAVRSAVVAALALALARPMLPVPALSDGPDAGSGPQDVVVLLDDSLSMSALAGQAPLLQRAQLRARQFIERLPQGSRIAVVATGFPARALVRQLTADRGAVLDAVRRAQAQPRRDDAVRAWSLAQAMLESDGVAPRRIVVFSDLQASGWQDAVPPVRSRGGEPIALQIDRLRPDSVENTAIVSATVSGSADGAGQVRVEVEVRHSGDRQFRDYVTLRSGDREVKSLVQLQPGESARRTFSLSAGAPWAEVLLPPDALAGDNRRVLRLDAPTSLRVALVNGAPRPTPRQDEVFFAARALEAGAQRSGEWTVDVLPADKLTAASLAEADVIVLANVAAPSPEAIATLKAAVESGKGLLVTLGDNLPDPPSAYLEGLLPAPVVGLRNAAALEGAGRGVTALQWAKATDGAERAVAALRQRLASSVGDALERTQVFRYALVQPQASLGDRVVAQFGDGAPALLWASLGRGKVALLTTSLDRDWTDLPLQPGYVPVLQELVQGLAGTGEADSRGPWQTGQTVQLSRSDRAEQLEVRFEGGQVGREPERLLLQAANQRNAHWVVRGLDEPGRYVATELRGGVALNTRPVVIVPTAADSDLHPAQQGPLLQAIDKPSAKGPQRMATAPGWTAVLLVLMGLLVAEAWTLARGARSRTVPQRMST